jgi:endogenous inhibitor of DNA gyrase (YacG/DUF329 family)
MSPFMETVERWCPTCVKRFLATIHTERVGKELARMTTPCPDCGHGGDILVEVPSGLPAG